MPPSGPISGPEADALVARANLKTSQQDLNAAFELHVQAAKAYLHLHRSSQASAAEKIRYRSKAEKSLEWAEKIKRLKGSSNAAPSIGGQLAEQRPTLKPIVRDRFAEEEQFAVLDQSSRINGLRFPPSLDKAPTTDLLLSETLFSDPTGQPVLAKAQIALFHDWKRPLELNSGILMTSEDLSPEDIVQDVVTDCSVIASLTVCWNHHKSHGSKLAISSLYPQDASGNPIMSEHGKYVVRLLFNGCSRHIRKLNQRQRGRGWSEAFLPEIDDQLPVSKDGRPLCASSRDFNVLWPALIEKAYMKLLGGYEFPGSNTSIDLHALTGWIPEHISISGTTQREKLWRRLYNGFRDGNCLLTLGTGLVVPDHELAIDLIASHNYAVTGAVDDGVRRQLKLLNPWHCPDTPFPRPGYGHDGRQPGADFAKHSIWMSWEAVCDIFESVFLNWNPATFGHSYSFHSFWKHDRGAVYQQVSDHRLRLNVAGSPHLIDGKSEPDIWVLLTRHITSTSHAEESDFISLRVLEDVPSEQPSRDALSDALVYTNSPHSLARIQVTSSDTLMSLIPLRDTVVNAKSNPDVPMSGQVICYTISIFSSVAFKLEDCFGELPYQETLSSTLSLKTSGGNSTFPTYMCNPQYTLELDSTRSDRDVVKKSSKVKVRVTLEGAKHVPFNVKLVWGGGSRVSELVQGDIAADSGPYTYGFATLSARVKPAHYTLICSPFLPGQLSSFELAVDSDCRFKIRPLAAEGDGMFSKVVRGSWIVSSDSRSSIESCHYGLSTRLPSKIMCRLRSVNTRKISLNISMYGRRLESDLEKVSSSGPFSDAPCGVVAQLAITEIGTTYVLAPSATNPGENAQFELLVYSTTCPVEIWPLNHKSAT